MAHNLTRREFLRILAMGSVGAVLAACAPQVVPIAAPTLQASASIQKKRKNSTTKHCHKKAQNKPTSAQCAVHISAQ